MKHKIFICYRRDNKELARSIHGRLGDEFGSDAIFMDFDAVGGGRDWKKRVVEVLEDKPIVVTLITTVWNSRRGGKPRLLREDDHVRFELKAALDRELAIIPVLYDRALWPKAEQLPSELHPILRFQKVPMSQDRWDYDVKELIKALRDLLGLPAGAGSTPLTHAVRRPAIGTGPAFQPLYTRAMFQETPEQRQQRLRELAERHHADMKRREKARDREPPFFLRWAFWIASLLTVILGIGALAGGEFMARGVASLTFSWTARWGWFPNGALPVPSILAAALLVGVWALGRVSLSASAYWHDPDLGGKVFFTRGVFGGYTLFFEDCEGIGIWAAWPIATVVPWVLSRIVAWVTLTLWAWNDELIFWLALGLYTVPVLCAYVLLTMDEMP
jgi:hypothetical protein